MMDRRKFLRILSLGSGAAAVASTQAGLIERAIKYFFFYRAPSAVPIEEFKLNQCQIFFSSYDDKIMENLARITIEYIKPVIVMRSGDVVLQDTPNPYWHGRLPFQILKGYPS